MQETAKKLVDSMSYGLQNYPAPLSHPVCLQWTALCTQDFPHTPLIWVHRSCSPQNSDRSLFMFPLQGVASSPLPPSSITKKLLTRNQKKINPNHPVILFHGEDDM